MRSAIYKQLSLRVTAFVVCCSLQVTLATAQLNLKEDFNLVEAPKLASKNWFTLNHSSAHYFKTELINGQLRITRTGFIDTIEFELPDGRLLGVNNGEWGGNISFVPTDTFKTKQLVAYGNIRNIFSFMGKIYFIHGIAHGTMKEGKLFRIDTSQSRFSATKVLDFDDSPEAMTIWNNHLLIASFEGFYVVDSTLEKRRLFDDMFWSSLYPSSVAVQDIEHVFIGLRGGIAELNLISNTTLFHKYKGIKFGDRKVDYNTPIYELNE